MADGASSAEGSLDDDSDFSHTSTTTGHRKRLDDNSDLLGRTRTAYSFLYYFFILYMFLAIYII